MSSWYFVLIDKVTEVAKSPGNYDANTFGDGHGLILAQSIDLSKPEFKRE